jgi:DHA3 family tetracycline resistance protein-like MFS transporter
MRRLSATSVYYGLELLLSMPTWVVVAVYLVLELHLSPLQLVLVGTAMEAAAFLFEIPTGVVADTYGRRLSLVIGYLGTGTAWLLVGVVSTPWAIIVLWAFWGLSYTFTSGAYEAWITEEVGAEKVGRVFMRGTRFGYIGSFLGLVSLVTLGTVSLRAAVIAGGAISIACGLICIFVMPETGFTPRPRADRASPLAELRATAAGGARFAWAQPVILLLTGVELFDGMSSEAFDRLREAHILRDVGLPTIAQLDPVVWFGIFSLLAMPFGFFAAGRLVRCFERSGTEGAARSLFGLTLVLLASYLVFALAGSIWPVVAALLAISLARRLASPLYMTWLNEQITDSSVRATVISLTGQSNAVGQAAGGPVLGVVANVWGIGVALTAGAASLAPALGLYTRALAHRGREPELEELPSAEVVIS